MTLEEKLLAYLQNRLTTIQKLEEDGYPQDYVEECIVGLIAYKEMVECLIEKPVNLEKSGKVTVGF